MKELVMMFAVLVAGALVITWSVFPFLVWSKLDRLIKAANQLHQDNTTAQILSAQVRAEIETVEKNTRALREANVEVGHGTR